MLTVRVTIPEYDEVTQWAIKDGKERGALLREMFDRERERRQQATLDRMASEFSEAAADRRGQAA
jgi:predicted Fe-S protein YdhL (DUF1289 family)